ncbi:hypothetical protein F4779DRAFT_598646 [Xylariaceae sp. FL0662B]|nr:hypothetical protein F4779DRAFT_598646 [Xylariaceae sp. FL0662B]
MRAASAPASSTTGPPLTAPSRPGAFHLGPLLLLWLLLMMDGAQAQDPTALPVYLPAYKPENWAELRGSIVGSNDAETTYTVFCAPPRHPGSTTCGIAGGDANPFTFVEGPQTLHYGNSVESSFALTLACALTGTTAASCSGSTSVAAGYTLAPSLTGPTQTSRAAAVYTAVQWGVLTLAEPPRTTTAKDGRTITDFAATASETGNKSSSASPAAGLLWMVVAVGCWVGLLGVGVL